MKFFKKRWHSIPIGIITAILLVCLLGGGVFAAYTAWTGTAEINVTEAFRVEAGPTGLTSVGVDINWSGNTVTINNLMPGQFAECELDIYNDSTVPLAATITITQTAGVTTWTVGDLADLTRIWQAGGVPVPVDSRMILQDQALSGVGNPIVLTIPGNGSMVSAYLWFQAGTDIAPGSYSFQLTVDR
ncbi:hypothetical protein ES705_50961 [subsurface metagenome]